jgi:cytoskeletal protein RodZ
MANRNRNNDEIVNNDSFKRTGSDKANQVAPSSPSEKVSQQPQTDAAASSADNDMDRMTTMQHNLQKDADEAQSDGNLSFPEGK